MLLELLGKAGASTETQITRLPSSIRTAGPSRISRISRIRSSAAAGSVKRARGPVRCQVQHPTEAFGPLEEYVVTRSDFWPKEIRTFWWSRPRCMPNEKCWDESAWRLTG